MKRGRRPPLGSNYPSDVVIHIPACAVPSGQRRHFVLPSLWHGSELIGELTAKICRAGFKVPFGRPVVHRNASPSCLSSPLCNQLLIKVAFWNSKTASAWFLPAPRGFIHAHLCDDVTQKRIRNPTLNFYPSKLKKKKHLSWNNSCILT